MSPPPSHTRSPPNPGRQNTFGHSNGQSVVAVPTKIIPSPIATAINPLQIEICAHRKKRPGSRNLLTFAKNNKQNGYLKKRSWDRSIGTGRSGSYFTAFTATFARSFRLYPKTNGRTNKVKCVGSSWNWTRRWIEGSGAVAAVLLLDNWSWSIVHRYRGKGEEKRKSTLLRLPKLIRPSARPYNPRLVCGHSPRGARRVIIASTQL